MDSSALLEETHELEMENPREGQEELNLNELNSFLNSIMNKCRSKFFYCRQMQILIGNTADAMTEISNLKKANENLKQTNEQLNKLSIIRLITLIKRPRTKIALA